jgi:regulator of protease activity HflC (stomatin/prohibitin superfamily)
MNKFWEILEWALKILPRFMTIPPDEGAVITRFGKPLNVLSEGGHYILIWPVIHEVTTVIVTRQIIDVPTQDVLTIDNINVCMNVSVEYIISDPYRAILEVEDFDQCIQELAGDMMRETVSDNEFAYCTTNMDDILLRVTEQLEDKVKQYGIEVMNVYLPTFTKGHTIRLIQQ